MFVYNFRYRPSYVFCYSVFKDRLLFRLEDQSSKTEQEMFDNSLLILVLSPLKGGDPSPRSRRDNLLRLNPSHRSYLRRLTPYGYATGFGYY